MSTQTSLCYVPGFGHNWTVPLGEEHRFIPSIHRQISPNTPISLDYVRWGITESAPQNPLESFQKYFREEHQSASTEAFDILQSHTHQHQPEILIAHSMGARVLFHAINKGLVLPSVQKIIFLQPDIPISFDMSRIANKMAAKNITFSHTWCPWDDLLGIISIYTGELRIGQMPHPEKQFRSHFFPLKLQSTKWNHTQILKQNINHIIDHPQLVCG